MAYTSLKTFFYDFSKQKYGTYFLISIRIIIDGGYNSGIDPNNAACERIEFA